MSFVEAFQFVLQEVMPGATSICVAGFFITAGVGMLLAGVISAATTITSGAMQTSATREAAAKAETLHEQQTETEEKRHKESMKFKRARLGMEKEAHEFGMQQYWTNRRDTMKQIDKQSVEKFGNLLTDKGSKDFMLKQAIHSLW